MRPGIRLGVDVGTVRVGLAASDPGGVLAMPVETLDRDPDSGSDQGVIAAAVLEQDVLEVVVGLPRSLSGDEGPAAAAVRSYATSLAAVISPTPVRLVDERLTTIDAHRKLRDSGMPGRAQRAVVDQAAAVLILQAALDAEKASGRPPGELVGASTRKPRARRTKAGGSRQ
jgi:putative Holliday junction resolvase